MSYSKYFSIDEEYYMIVCNSTGPSLPVHHILCEHFIPNTHYTFNKPSHCFVLDITNTHHTFPKWVIASYCTILHCIILYFYEKSVGQNSEWRVFLMRNFLTNASTSTFMQYPRQLTNSFTSLFTYWQALAEC